VGELRCVARFVRFAGVTISLTGEIRTYGGLV